MRRSGSLSGCIPEEPDADDQYDEGHPEESMEDAESNEGDNTKENIERNLPFRAGYKSAVELKELDLTGILKVGCTPPWSEIVLLSIRALGSGDHCSLDFQKPAILNPTWFLDSNSFVFVEVNNTLIWCKQVIRLQRH